MLQAMKFSLILWGLGQLLKYAAWRHPAFRARLKERNLVAQFKARDEEIGRWYALRDGQVSTGRGLRADADVTIACKNAALGANLLMPPIDWLDQINAQKDFKLTVDGAEDLTNWFAQTVMAAQSAGLEFGTRMPDGTIQYRARNSVDRSGLNAQSTFNGTENNDRVVAGNDNDTIWGNEGDDRIEGGAGNDVALGGEGDDIITDLGGDDVPKGGPGNDAIDAGPGADIVMGGTGTRSERAGVPGPRGHAT